MERKEELQSILSLVDVKLEQNSKSVNVTLHIYEGAEQEKIHELIRKAVDGLLYSDRELRREGLKQ
jgi:methionine synthase II (cobalamin-independent)